MGRRDLEPMKAAALSPEPLAALNIEGVSHSYGKRKALDHVSFKVAPASFTVLLGLNGAGKSTLVSLITRLFAPGSGRITIFGYDVNRAPTEALRRLGIVFQARTLDLDLSVAQNLAYHAALHGILPREAKARTRALMEQIGLSDRLSDKVRNLSGGEMRRVEIARALLHRPRMLILDEPTVGLDIKARADLLAHVRGLVAQDKIGVLWATHLIDEIEEGDDVVILHRGTVLDHGKIADVTARTGTSSIGAAFRKLTGLGKAEESAE
jgi:ABC-2 type transport system ATP-binding protein